jgi:DNA-binding MarR family transcriptional regulator
LFDESYQSILNIINNYLEKNYKIIFISRNINQEINKLSKNSKFEIINFSSKNEINNINSPDLLLTIIKKKIKTNSIIIINRLDYLFNQYDFNEIITILYNINDIIIKNKSILIIKTNPDLLSKKELTTLNEEFYNYPHEKINQINIDKDLYDILHFINSKNKNNIYVTYRDIGTEFSISKITVAKKIENLIDKNLIYTHKKGRNKILELTNLGKDIISS